MAVPPNDTAAAPRTTPLTPAMKQYHDAKRQYRDAILFFRMGDFYEMFFEDALVAARALDLTLTSRSNVCDAGCGSTSWSCVWGPMSSLLMGPAPPRDRDR